MIAHVADTADDDRSNIDYDFRMTYLLHRL